MNNYRNELILEKEIFNCSSSEDFSALALGVFNYQYESVDVYREFCSFLKVSPSEVRELSDIPFLPIEFFKSHKIMARDKTSTAVFTSSGTTASVTSKHYIADLGIYERSFSEAFKARYGNIEDAVILALLPSYLERQGSSLIYMVDQLIKKTKNELSGFFLNNTNELIEKIALCEKLGQKTILIGVSYALLDLIENQSFQLNNTIIMETGGMKGKRKEMVKEELHEILKKDFGVSQIHSEYGMTELLSQAYSSGNGIFNCPSWMRVLTRDPEDAFSMVENITGGINVIDLANIHSCSFIATQDLGKCQSDGSFEILGRFDTSDIRGCNLMVL